MRKIAMVLFKQDDTKFPSMARKKKMAGLDDDYRSTLQEYGIKMRRPYHCHKVETSKYNIPTTKQADAPWTTSSKSGLGNMQPTVPKIYGTMKVIGSV